MSVCERERQRQRKRTDPHMVTHISLHECRDYTSTHDLCPFTGGPPLYITTRVRQQTYLLS